MTTALIIASVVWCLLASFVLALIVGHVFALGGDSET